MMTMPDISHMDDYMLDIVRICDGVAKISVKDEPPLLV